MSFHCPLKRHTSLHHYQFVTRNEVQKCELQASSWLLELCASCIWDVTLQDSRLDLCSHRPGVSSQSRLTGRPVGC